MEQLRNSRYYICITNVGTVSESHDYFMALINYRTAIKSTYRPGRALNESVYLLDSEKSEIIREHIGMQQKLEMQR